MSKKWNIDIDPNSCEATFTPDMEEMKRFVVKASAELTEKIMEAEEKLVLTAVSEEGIERLIMLCEQELRRRKRK